MKIGVVISSYNQPEWLRKCLTGFTYQSLVPDEVLIADDGSDHCTAEVVKSFAACLPIKHVWHEDSGFRKTEILNKAIIAAESAYLVFTDGDCIPRRDFLAVHRANAANNRMLSGGYVKLSMDASQAITATDIKTGSCFTPEFLRQHMNLPSLRSLKLTSNRTWARVLDTATTTRSSWNGHNASTFRNILLQANGFDSRMKYGGEDRELGERLANKNVQARTVRHRAVCLHLEHERGYVNQTDLDINNAIRRETRQQNITRTPHGIDEITPQKH